MPVELISFIERNSYQSICLLFNVLLLNYYNEIFQRVITKFKTEKEIHKHFYYVAGHYFRSEKLYTVPVDIQPHN